VLVSSDHPMAERAELQVGELAGETMIARRSCELLSETSKFFTARGVRPQFLIRSADEDRCLALVRAGFGITTGPASLASAGIVALRLAGYNYYRTLGLVSPRSRADAMLEAAWTTAARSRG
jgi:DNA-binding transcriptional LysR family regulator